MFGQAQEVADSIVVLIIHRHRTLRGVFLLIQAISMTLFMGAQEDVRTVIPRDYRGIELGMPPDGVKEALLMDSWFNYRGEEDVSLLERPRASLIDAGGTLFIARGLFQFEDNALSGIILELDPSKIDWFTIYTTLEDRYGAPTDLDPTKAWWEDGQTRLALERPLTVKYLDMNVYNAGAAEETAGIAWRERARSEFLNEF